jgi:alkylation response protein AidB-like acyl-CoA dehydrogenase
VQFELAAYQRDLLDAVTTLLERRAGVARCRELGGATPRYDHDLERALREAGFFDVAADPSAGPLDAALIGELVAHYVGVVSYTATALVAPGLGLDPLEGPVAMTTRGHRGPVRFASDACHLLVLEGDRVRLLDIEVGTFPAVPTRFGCPLGDIQHLPEGGTLLADGSGQRMLAWWQLGLAIEAVGTMSAALAVTVEHTRTRKQFGRAIGSFQAVQHRLAELRVLVEGARWLTLETAWSGAPSDRASLALTHACSAARRLPGDTHQLSGAIGFAEEYDLHLWTNRLPALVVEAAWLGRTATAELATTSVEPS